MGCPEKPSEEAVSANRDKEAEATVTPTGIAERLNFIKPTSSPAVPLKVHCDAKKSFSKPKFIPACAEPTF